MVTRSLSDEALERVPAPQAADLIQRILPRSNPDRQARAQAWAEWQVQAGEHVLARFVSARNNTRESDEDIIQDALLTAYLGVESERYQPREGIPFTAYVVGIARNKIREARRRERWLADLNEDGEETGQPASHMAGEPAQRQPERAVERREERRLLHSRLAHLPEARRQVLEQYLAGASTGEIAGQMAISEALVRQHKCRGLRALQRSLVNEPFAAD